jgi:acyl-CoA-binding protein
MTNRELTHLEKRVVMDGPNNRIRAPRDPQTGLCERYNESLNRHFLRIILFFADKNRGDYKCTRCLYEPENKVDPERDLPTNDALELYGLSMQSLFGDNPEPEPGYFDFSEHYKWSAWEELRGTPQHIVKDRFVTFAEEQLDKLGIDYHDRLKPGKDYYQGCKGFINEPQTFKKSLATKEGRIAESVAVEKPS